MSMTQKKDIFINKTDISKLVGKTLNIVKSEDDNVIIGIDTDDNKIYTLAVKESVEEYIIPPTPTPPEPPPSLLTKIIRIC